MNRFLFAARVFFLPLDYSFCRKSFSFCREVNSFAVTVVGHRTGQYCKSKLASGFVFQGKADWLSFQTYGASSAISREIFFCDLNFVSECLPLKILFKYLIIPSRMGSFF